MGGKRGERGPQKVSRNGGQKGAEGPQRVSRNGGGVTPQSEQKWGQRDPKR